MADAILHARAVSPWFVPNKGGTARDLHGLSNISLGSSVDSEDVFVIGKQDKCATDKSTPEATVSATQYERGEINSYLTLANLDALPSGGMDLNDFSAALVDVVLYERDEFDGTIVGTKWVPKTAISSLAIDISDPESRIERSFELAGNNKHELSGDNAILVHVKATAGSGVSGNFVIDVTDYGVPAADPNNSGAYILRVDRTRDGETVEIALTTDYTYNPTGEVVTILAAETDDVYNVYFSTDDFGVEGDPTTVDTADPCFLKANSVRVLLSDGTTELELDILTSLSISASIERIDESVIGSDEYVLREISATPVEVSLSGRVKDSTILDAFMGKLAAGAGITDINKYLDNVRVTVLIYSDSTKSTFLLGYQTDGLSFTSDGQDITAGEFGTLDVSASSTNLLISNQIADMTLI